MLAARAKLVGMLTVFRQHAEENHGNVSKAFVEDLIIRIDATLLLQIPDPDFTVSLKGAVTFSEAYKNDLRHWRRLLSDFLGRSDSETFLLY